jgi:methyl-accepting chemotaxis protein
MPDDVFRWAIAGGVAIATLCIAMMAVISLMLYRMVSRVQSRVDSVAERVEPIIETVRKLANENGPKVTIIAGNAVEISNNAKEISIVARDQAHRFAEVGRDIADRTKAQVARVDAVVDDTVDKVHQAGDNVKAAVSKPVREAGAVLAGVKAAVSTLATGRRPTVDHITQDEEMFI